MDGRKVEIQKRMGEHTIFCKKIQIITQEIESQNECAMNARKSSSNRLLLPAGILILLLMIAVGYLVSENAKYKGLARQYEMDVAEMQVLQTTLEEEYQIAQDELEALKGENEEMNTLITRQQVQLSEQKQRIDRLMRDSRNLSLARAEDGSFGLRIGGEPGGEFAKLPVGERSVGHPADETVEPLVSTSGGRGRNRLMTPHDKLLTGQKRPSGAVRLGPIPIYRSRAGWLARPPIRVYI